jgi:hypothetical protein
MPASRQASWLPPTVRRRIDAPVDTKSVRCHHHSQLDDEGWQIMVHKKKRSRAPKKVVSHPLSSMVGSLWTS